MKEEKIHSNVFWDRIVEIGAYCVLNLAIRRQTTPRSHHSYPYDGAGCSCLCVTANDEPSERSVLVNAFTGSNHTAPLPLALPTTSRT